MKTTLSLLILAVLSIGCESKPPPSTSKEKAEQPAVEEQASSGWDIRFETLSESLVRSETESKSRQEVVRGEPAKEWYGKTLVALGPIRQVIVPHVAPGAGNWQRVVSKESVLAALNDYQLIDKEKMGHIPLGTPVRVEYEDGLTAMVNMVGEAPYSVWLLKDGVESSYGLENRGEKGELGKTDRVSQPTGKSELNGRGN